MTVVRMVTGTATRFWHFVVRGHLIDRRGPHAPSVCSCGQEWPPA